ncbi:MAG TPA: AMP-binding protein, partial [Candidatus Eisenbacteria bacterium]|nr:AMP-binding protein [Candidatus Eisenbacteria bacterium]
MTIEPPERRNIADLFLDARLREGRGDRPAVLTDSRAHTYAEIHALANRYGNLLVDAGADPEDRILIALPDGPDYVGALFGTLKIGAVVVMVNPGLPAAEIAALLDYTRARIVVTDASVAAAFREAARG